MSAFTRAEERFQEFGPTVGISAQGVLQSDETYDHGLSCINPDMRTKDTQFYNDMPMATEETDPMNMEDDMHAEAALRDQVFHNINTVRNLEEKVPQPTPPQPHLAVITAPADNDDRSLMIHPPSIQDARLMYQTLLADIEQWDTIAEPKITYLCKRRRIEYILLIFVIAMGLGLVVNFIML
jgi:hypothetical protein